MQRVRARLIADRKEEVEGVAQMIYSEKQRHGEQGQTDGFADWVEAENRVIRGTFERQTGCTLSLTSSMLVSLISYISLCFHITVSVMAVEAPWAMLMFVLGTSLQLFLPPPFLPLLWPPTCRHAVVGVRQK